jgi:hypothetical protein
MAERDKLIEDMRISRPALHATYVSAQRRVQDIQLFIHESGRFPTSSYGRLNTAPLFVELVLALGRYSGLIVPTGIATDAFNQYLFQLLINGKRLARLIDFENRAGLFPSIDSRMKFSLLTIDPRAEQTGFAFFLTEPSQLADQERHFTLSAEAIARINPATKTAPVFRSRADAELTTKFYSRFPILLDETNGRDGNPWGLSFQLMFYMNTDSVIIRTAAQLSSAGFVRDTWMRHVAERGGFGHGPRHAAERYVPLNEGEYGHQFDHRFATLSEGTVRKVTLVEKRDPAFEVNFMHWVPEEEFKARLARRAALAPSHLLGFRRVARSNDERTVIGAILPTTAASYGWTLTYCQNAKHTAVLCANYNSLVFDYCLRNKLSQPSIPQGVFYQMPVPPPSLYTSADMDFIVPRVLELSYTSHSIAPFGRDLGFDGPPFVWDEDRRAQLRAELDAWYARAYGVTRDELRFILDPADVKGANYPSETFRVLKTNEIRRLGEYRTARLVLAAYDQITKRPAVAK